MSDILHTIILIIHVLGACAIIGISFVSLLIQLKPPVTADYLKLLERIWKIAGIALGLQLVTGIYLALSEWDTVGVNPLFWVKMVLFFVAGGIIGSVSRKQFNKLQSGAEAAADTKLAWIGLITFALVAAIGVIIVETAA